MTRFLQALDEYLARLSRVKVSALAASGALVVGWIDYVTGYEASLSLFYLGPIAMGAWYAGQWAGIATAVVSCVAWYVADVAAGGQYSHPAIAVWNALIRFGFFLVTALLLTALRRSLRAHQELARIDGLTGLYGRRAFEERLGHDLALAQRRGTAVTLAYVDLDDFKAVNDTHGHAAGDWLLRTIGRTLKGSIRETDTAARIGGDEFALLLPDTDGRGAELAVKKIVREIHSVLGAGHSGVTCSIGVVTFLDGAVPPERAVAAADELMYRVKHQGKGGVAFSELGRRSQSAVAAPGRQTTAR